MIVEVFDPDAEVSTTDLAAAAGVDARQVSRLLRLGRLEGRKVSVDNRDVWMVPGSAANEYLAKRSERAARQTSRAAAPLSVTAAAADVEVQQLLASSMAQSRIAELEGENRMLRVELDHARSRVAELEVRLRAAAEALVAGIAVPGSPALGSGDR